MLLQCVIISVVSCTLVKNDKRITLAITTYSHGDNEQKTTIAWHGIVYENIHNSYQYTKQEKHSHTFKQTPTNAYLEQRNDTER